MSEAGMEHCPRWLRWSTGGLALLASCAAPRSTSVPSEASPPATSTAAVEADPAVLEDPSDAELDREIRLHTLRLEHGDPTERARAQLDLGDAYVRRASRVQQARFDLQAQGDERRAEREHLEAELEAQRDQWLARAAAAYEAVVTSSPPGARSLRTEARFGLADVRMQQGEAEAAREHLRALLLEDPEHALAGLALLHLGDDAFAAQRLDEARALYERALRFDDLHTRSHARYKLGWIALDHDDGQEALVLWTQVVNESRHDPSLHALTDAAAKDCVLAYARVGPPEAAGAFFSRLQPERSHHLLESLARRYLDQGRPDAAAVVRGHAPGASAPAGSTAAEPQPRLEPLR
ncbi:MAG: tetratricopeptide repeat protein [Myxococcales bacterium]|nr:tetratricopeptide repeat protein [Myxococcales bacterium]